MLKIQNGKAVLQAGFHLVTDSWENDGDYRNTITQVFYSEEEAKLVNSIVKKHAKAYGNQYDYKQQFVLYTDSELDYIFKDEENIEELKAEYRVAVLDKNKKAESVDIVSDIVGELAYELMGGSECYTCRVHDGSYIIHVPHTVEYDVVE